MLQILFLAGMIIIAYLLEAGIYFYLGILSASFLSLYQQYLIRYREKKACFEAFLNNNWLGMVIFIGIFLNYQYH